MRFVLCCTAVFLAASAPLAAHAQAPSDAPAVKVGAALYSADARRIGRIDRVIPASDGSPGWASVIFDSRFVSIPVTTISAGEKGVVTSLSRADVRKLR